MAHSRIPTYCQSPTASPPGRRALLIGISYASPAGYNEKGYRELKGPVNNAKEMKKALIELFHYKEEDIRSMTDEEANMNTALWPSKENIMHELRNLVRDAYPGDAFVFFYTGHCGQQRATTDLNEYIVTCDHEIILDNTLREYLVDPLPSGTRLTAILDACHSGTLLELDHYFCHHFRPQRARSLQEKAVKHYEGHPPRHHSDDDAQHWLRAVRGATWLFHMTFSFVATIMLAIVRFKVRLVKKRKQVKAEVEVEVVDCVDHAALPPSPASFPRPPCGGPFCVNAFSNGAIVISVSSCSDRQSTWEDSQNKGRSMTTKLVKILRENPSINVGDLDQRLTKSLTRTGVKRLREAKSRFKTYSAKLSPERRKKYEDMYTELGLFDLGRQVVQFGSQHSLRHEEEFIVKRAYTLDLQLDPLLHF